MNKIHEVPSRGKKYGFFGSFFLTCFSFPSLPIDLSTNYIQQLIYLASLLFYNWFRNFNRKEALHLFFQVFFYYLVICCSSLIYHAKIISSLNHYTNTKDYICKNENYFNSFHFFLCLYKNGFSFSIKSLLTHDISYRLGSENRPSCFQITY